MGFGCSSLRWRFAGVVGADMLEAKLWLERQSGSSAHFIYTFDTTSYATAHFAQQTWQNKACHKNCATARLAHHICYTADLAPGMSQQIMLQQRLAQHICYSRLGARHATRHCATSHIAQHMCYSTPGTRHVTRHCATLHFAQHRCYNTPGTRHVTTSGAQGNSARGA